MDWLEALRAENVADIVQDGHNKKEVEAYFAPDEDEQIEINRKKEQLIKQGYSKTEIKILLEPDFCKILCDRIKNLDNAFPTDC